VPDHPRIEELRRRVQKDPASLAFAHLAEEYRRAGRFEEAIVTCRAGLKTHPTYLSAKVTLGRALIEVGDLEAAQDELQAVMAAAPENLAAIRGLAEVHQRRGEHQEALDYYQWALQFAGNDPELARQISSLTEAVQPPGAPPHATASPNPPAAPPAPDAAEPSGQAAAQIAPAPAVPVEEPAAIVTPAQTDGQAHSGRQAEALQRFLHAIVADRERRHTAR
jgi:tetratricopeptide (TPR) repeat protein